MPTMPMLAPKLAEDKPDRTTEMPPSDQADTQEFAQESATIKKPGLEPIHDHLKNSTLTTSEEDASDGIPTKRPTKIAASENLDSTSKATKDLADCGMVEGSGDTEGSTAGSTDARMDPKPSEKVKSGKGNKISGSGEFSDDDSQDDDDINAAISEEDDLAYTAEGQKLYKQRATKRIKLFGQYLWNVEYRMGFLESELKNLKGDKLETQQKDNAEKVSAATSEVIPSIRRLNWADYKGDSQDAPELGTSAISQRFTSEGIKGRQSLQEKGEPHFAKASVDQHDAIPGKHQHHVLEVLIEEPGIQKRRRVRKYNEDENITKISGRNTTTYQESDVIPAQTSKTTLQCPERLRICSKPLAEILHRISISDPEGGVPQWGAPYIVFLRPFKFFVLYQTEIRDTLKDLEKKWQSKEQPSSGEKTGQHNPEERQGEANNGIEVEDTKEDIATLEPAADTAMKTPAFEALEPLRLLVEFLDNDLKSTFALLRQIDAKEARSIVFADLWHLYKYGQEVRAPDDKLQVFKVAKFTGGRDLLTKSMLPSDPKVPSSCLDREESNGAFFIECYRYDFDGTQYGPVHKMFKIHRYEGLRDIRSLQVYPLCYDPEHQKERNRLVQRGEKFMTLARVNKTAHKTYRGLSLDEHAEEVSQVW